MITINGSGPVEVKTILGTVLVSTLEDGQIIIEVFQKHGIRKYHLSGQHTISLRDGKLIERKNT